ncbi:hypothetical protein [Arthrobacter sp. ISL-65]|uniref:hypothetical protein n=1 Tax=Arthrobacter sp. ISL-65 TaxID=2819112 RepID=UPI001BE9E5A1|nr:hypothetical protein [Arthrobacter sp. ISL-65]MBT2548319.1 hypothetical protein [Arthrobacter sp. ISL-65]
MSTHAPLSAAPRPPLPQSGPLSGRIGNWPDPMSGRIGNWPDPMSGLIGNWPDPMQQGR